MRTVLPNDKLAFAAYWESVRADYWRRNGDHHRAERCEFEARALDARARSCESEAA